MTFIILAIVFLVIALGLAGFTIYRSVSLVKTPMLETNYKAFFIKSAYFLAGAIVSFVTASFFVVLRNKEPLDFLHTFQLVLGGILFFGLLFASINVFIVHYYGRNIPEKLDKWLFRTIMIGFTASVFFFFIYTNGLAPYLGYPLHNGISFTEGLVRPNKHANIAFYAICILSGAILVYFLCDHYMYKEYGEHGIFESTFFVAFPAGIIGGRIGYVIGNWGKEFAGEPFWKVFEIWNGGLTILAGAPIGIAAGVAWFLWRKKGKSIWIAADIVLPAILIAQAVGRWGNFFNCEVHGVVSNVNYWKWLPEIVWRNAWYTTAEGLPLLDGSKEIYVPLFFIEAITNILGYFVLQHVFGRALRKHTELGDLGCGYIIWYGLTRLFMEPLRVESFKMGMEGYWSWVWSMIFVIVGVIALITNHLVRRIIRKKKNTFKVKENDKKVGLISSAALLVVGAALTIVSVIMMTGNQFEARVIYNGFNVGLMILVVGVSLLLCLAISLPILIDSFKKKQEVHE